MVGNVLSYRSFELTMILVMGFQYLTLARILLVVYDPSIPRVGPAHKTAIEKIDVSCFSLCHACTDFRLKVRGQTRRVDPLWSRNIESHHSSCYPLGMYGNKPL